MNGALRNHCNIFWVYRGIHSQNGGHDAYVFTPYLVWIPPSTQKIITMIHYMYHYISTLLNAYFDFDVSVSNDVAFDVAKCAVPGKVMQGSHCLEVRTHINQ